MPDWMTNTIAVTGLVLTALGLIVGVIALRNRGPGTKAKVKRAENVTIKGSRYSVKAKVKDAKDVDIL